MVKNSLKNYYILAGCLSLFTYAIFWFVESSPLLYLSLAWLIPMLILLLAIITFRE